MQSAGQKSRRPARPALEDAQQGNRANQQPLPGKVNPDGPFPPEDDPGEAAPISSEEIRVALLGALKSPEFQPAPQLRAFLEFVVNAALDNQRNNIKGYTIAVEALGRAEDFNPVTDPIVRVEAARLRQRLAKYYAGSGADAPVRIAIPKGSYAPQFKPAGNRKPRETATLLRQPRRTDVTVPVPEPGGAKPEPTEPPPAAMPQDMQTLFPPEAETARRTDMETLRTVTAAILAETSPPARPSGTSSMRGPVQRRLPLPAILALALAMSAAGFLAGFLIGYLAGSS